MIRLLATLLIQRPNRDKFPPRPNFAFDQARTDRALAAAAERAKRIAAR